MKYKITLTFEWNEEGSNLSGEITDENGKEVKSMEAWEMATLSFNLHHTANRWLERGLRNGIFQG